MTRAGQDVGDPRVVILAGGKGRRLAPRTDNLPKTLLPVGGRPVLDHILQALAAEGFSRVVLSVGHLASMIEAHVADSGVDRAFGLRIEYVRESTPLGTAGVLSLLDTQGPVLVINGDILTDMRFRDVVSAHHEGGSDMTVAVQSREFPIPLGVVDVDGDGRIRSLSEKPTVRLDCALGVNVYGPAAVAVASRGGAIDFPDVVEALMAAGHVVGGYRFDGAWFDIGDEDGYRTADEAIQMHRVVPTGGEAR